jgi:hypothetical protein
LTSEKAYKELCSEAVYGRGRRTGHRRRERTAEAAGAWNQGRGESRVEHQAQHDWHAPPFSHKRGVSSGFIRFHIALESARRLLCAEEVGRGTAIDAVLLLWRASCFVRRTVTAAISSAPRRRKSTTLWVLCTGPTHKRTRKTARRRRGDQALVEKSAGQLSPAPQSRRRVRRQSLHNRIRHLLHQVP